jgi:hypothetical protein
MNNLRGVDLAGRPRIEYSSNQDFALAIRNLDSQSLSVA